MSGLDDNTLVAYVDGELDAAAAADVERRLREDPAARNKVLKLTQSSALIRAVHSSLVHQPVPEHLLDLLNRPLPWYRRLRRPLAAALVGAVIGLAGGFAVGTIDGGWGARTAAEGVLDEIAAYHAFYAGDRRHLVEVPAQHKAELERWLGQHLKRPLEVPDLTARGFDFAGGRLLVAEGKPVAQLMYTAEGQEPLALCITTGAGDDRPAVVLRRHGLTLVSWLRDGWTYVLVGEAGEAVLYEVADLLAAPRASS